MAHFTNPFSSSAAENAGKAAAKHLKTTILLPCGCCSHTSYTGQLYTFLQNHRDYKIAHAQVVTLCLK